MSGIEQAEITAEEVRRLPRDLAAPWPEPGCPCDVLHKMREGAEAAAVRIARERGMPDGKDPRVWGNIGVNVITPNFLRNVYVFRN